MGAGKKVKNVAKTSKGKMKETTGKAVGNESLEAKGRGEQALGDAKQTVQKAKDTLKH
ncbi:CsbD family protein [Streptomyces sp. NBC_00190]|uniref:CsbD family protein n=1 Tax=unclassified Streptomyces TaxID=2593676 RepID=UPI002E2D498F|nr:CsbD family protein [Streptomyces sp. NBC_00190]WSZ38139.1 CsbD family protein [Streptomyces sp. NBC_00868]